MPRKNAKINLEMMAEECIRIIEASGARLETAQTGQHYLLSSGTHSESFFNLSRVFERFNWRNFFAQFFLRSMKAQGIDPGRIDVLAGPAIGSLPLLYALQSFPELEQTRVIYAERGSNGSFGFAKGFSASDDEEVFIIDDVGTTFSSLKMVKKLLDDAFNPVIIGAGVVIDRSPEGTLHALSKALGMQVVSGMRVPLVHYKADECPHCAEGRELVKV